VGPSISITETCKKNELKVKQFEGNRVYIIGKDVPVRVKIQENKEKQHGQKIVSSHILDQTQQQDALSCS
jgi:hypothetical protein